MTDAITTTALGKTYRQLWRAPFPAVMDLSLSVPQGAVFGLLGPNGAGKTTTIMMLLGLLRATHGSFSIFGQGMKDRRVRARIGYVPEKFQLPGFLQAHEFLGYQGQLYGMERQTLSKRIDEVLKLVSLSERKHSFISDFSKGMQQRLAMAQALMNDPDLILLDEPTSALDPVGRKDVQGIVEGLRDRGKTVLLNSHILSDVERVCDHYAIMRAGRLERQGSLTDLKASQLQLRMRIAGFDPELEGQLATLGQSLQILAPGEITELQLDLSDESAIPGIAAAVHAGGARLYALVPQRESLEDLFLRVIKEEK